ncbi:MAG: hypothetical protein R6V01_02350 [Thermoplasmatota archaeon]
MKRVDLSGPVIGIAVVVLLSSLLSLWSDDAMVSGHAPQSMDLKYDYADQILNVTITHTVPLIELGQHYIDEVTVSKNDVLVIEETYDSQPTRETFSFEYFIEAEDGDVLEVYAHCSVTGDLTEEMTVVGPRDRMTMSIQPDTLTYVEMGKDQDLTVLIERLADGNPVEGASLEVRADLGEVTEASDLGIGAYQFTYTAPMLDNEDIEVVNITASKNGYHRGYFEFSFDITYPLDPDYVLVVDISPSTATLKEGGSKDFSVTVTTESGKPADVKELILQRSGGQVSQDRTGTGEFTVLFKANQVQSDTTGFLAVTAEKEGYQKGYRKIMISIQDVPSSVTDDDDDVGEVGGGGGLFSGYNLVFIIVVLIIILVIVGFIMYRMIRKKRTKSEYEEAEIPPEYLDK